MSEESSLRKETFLSENRNPAQMKTRGKGVLYRNGMQKEEDGEEEDFKILFRQSEAGNQL